MSAMQLPEEGCLLLPSSSQFFSADGLPSLLLEDSNRPQHLRADALLQGQPNQPDNAAEQQQQPPLPQQQLAVSCRSSEMALSIDGPLAPYFSQQQLLQHEQQRPNTAPTTVRNESVHDPQAAAAAEQLQHWQQICNNELYGRSVTHSVETAMLPQQQQMEVLDHGMGSEKMSILHSQPPLQLPVQGTEGAPIERVLQCSTDNVSQSSICNDKRSAAAETAAAHAAATEAVGGSDMLNNVGLHAGSDGLQLMLERVQGELLAARHSNQELQELLSTAHSRLAEQQQQLEECKAQFANADKGRIQLQEQVEHLTAKGRMQESQLEFAHKQLDTRLQEVRGQMDAAATAGRAADVLQAQLAAAKDEIISTRKELEAVTKKMMVEAADARRSSDELSALRRELAQLNSELLKVQQELSDHKDRARQQQAEAAKRVSECEARARDLSLQLTGQQQALQDQQFHCTSLQQQLQDADSAAAALASQLAHCRQELAAAGEAQDHLAQRQADSTRMSAALQDELADLTSQNMLFRAQNSRLSEQLAAAEGTIRTLSTELGMARRAADTAAQRANQLQQHHLSSKAAPAWQSAASGGSRWLEAEQQHGAVVAEADRLARFSPGSCGAPGVAVQSANPGGAYQYQPSSSSHPDAAPGLRQGSCLANHRRQQDSPTAAPYSQVLVVSSRAGEYSPPVQQGSPAMPRFTVSPSRANAWCLPYAVEAADNSISTWQPAAARQSTDMPPWYHERGGGPGALAQHGAVQQLQPDFSQAQMQHPSQQQPWQSERQAQHWQQMQQQSSSLAALSSSTSPARLAAEASQQHLQQQRSSYGAGLGNHRPGQLTGSSIRPLSGPDAFATDAGVAVASPTADASMVLRNGPASGNLGSSSSPFGTQLTVTEIMAATKQLEDLLLAQSQEKDELSKEYAKMPLGAGRTLKERQRKLQVEERLEELDKLISKTRMQLKKMLGK